MSAGDVGCEDHFSNLSFRLRKTTTFEPQRGFPRIHGRPKVPMKHLDRASEPALSQPGQTTSPSGHFCCCAPLRQNHTLFSDPEISAAPASSINVSNLLSRGSKRPPSHRRAPPGQSTKARPGQEPHADDRRPPTTDDRRQLCPSGEGVDNPMEHALG